jgi:hypothetical protein
MAVQTENQATHADVNGGLKGESNGAKPKIVRAVDDEGGTTDAKVSRAMRLRSDLTLYSRRRATNQPG